jgi:hypothetical protein
MSTLRQIAIGSCVAIVVTALLGGGCGVGLQPDQPATMHWTDANAQSTRDVHGNIVSTLQDTEGDPLGVLVVKSASTSVEWLPASGAARSIPSQSTFSGKAGLQEANALAYATWKPGSKLAYDCQSACTGGGAWCCTCEASGGGSCYTCCDR